MAADEALSNKAEGKASKKHSQVKAQKEVKQTPIGNFKSIEDFTKNGLSEIVATTKTINAFPQGAAHDLYCSYPTYRRIIDDKSQKILGLISHVLKQNNIKGNIQRRQPDEQFEMLLEFNDTVLERVNSNLDELAGIKRVPQTIIVESKANTNVITVNGKEMSGAGSWNLKYRANEKSRSLPVARLITGKNIARPQVNFPVPVDNSENNPFVPKITEKPNSIKPLAILPEYDDAGNIVSYLHPYEFELMKFQVPDDQLKTKEPKEPLPIAETELVVVNNVAALRKALAELQAENVIAVDLEHHSYRTFLGFTCLLQISTRLKDYIFDALSLREELHVLNEVFTNPKVLKIFHGADLDIEWLQRDLAIYVVNMFDTHQAVKALNFARLSLAYLLKHYCNLDLDKTYQLADWRIRPLPDELIDYARQDTHYLIYAYERLTNDLLNAANQQTNLLRTVYERSTDVCKKRYKKPYVGNHGHMDVWLKSKRAFDNRQLYALEKIFQWRNKTAREEDESYGYVLPNHMMLQIAESLPREMQGILACCNPIPPLVRQHLHKLHEIVLRAREQQLVKPIFETTPMLSSFTTERSGRYYNDKLHCPHDLSNSEFRDDLPTLLKCYDNQTIVNVKQTDDSLCTDGAAISYFEKKNSFTRRLDQRPEYRALLMAMKRYLGILPIAEQERLDEAKRIEKELRQRKLCPDASDVPQLAEDTVKAESVDEKYTLPIKEIRKRQHEESVAKKALNTRQNRELPEVKRVKVERPPQEPEAPIKTEVIAMDSSSDEGPEEQPSTSRASTVGRQAQPNNRSNSKPKFKKFNHRLMKTGQPSDKPIAVNFDYNKVDFNKFKGGAQYVKGTELKPQFHAKNNANKNNNKKFNKLFTFSNKKGSGGKK